MNPRLEEMLRLALENTQLETSQIGARKGMGDFTINHLDDPMAEIQGRLDPRGAIAKIDQSFVSPTMRGQGIGRDMYMRAVQLAKDTNRYLTSDRTVSDKAKNVYQGMANEGLEVYRGDDVTQYEDMSRFHNDPQYQGTIAADMESYNNNLNSMGGPVFAVVPPGMQGGGLEDMLHEYMRIPRDEAGKQNVLLVATTYQRMKAEAKEEIPSDPEGILNDPVLKAVVAAVMGGGMAAGAASSSGDPEMAELLP